MNQKEIFIQGSIEIEDLAMASLLYLSLQLKCFDRLQYCNCKSFFDYEIKNCMCVYVCTYVVQHNIPAFLTCITYVLLLHMHTNVCTHKHTNTQYPVYTPAWSKKKLLQT